VATNILFVLKTLEELEGEQAKLYGWYSEVFADEDRPALFFYKLSTEKTALHNVCRFLGRIVQRNLKMFDDLDFDLVQLQALVQRVRQLRGAGQPSLAAAVWQCLDLESVVREGQLVALAEGSEEMKPLLATLGKGVRRHREDIQNFAAELGFLPKNAGAAASIEPHEEAPAPVFE